MPSKAIAVVAMITAMMLCACQDFEQDWPDQSGNAADGTSLSGSLVVPDMLQTQSRGILGDNPKSGLKLTILEFDKGADDEHSFLSNVYKAELKQSTVNNIVEFSFTLKAATTAKELHLFLANDYIMPEYGSIATILPQLTVGKPGSEYEAYWGRQSFPDGFTDITEADGVPTLLPEVKTKLTKVPMIRNFAKVTVTENLANFELLGFDLVNVPTSGTIAPWDQTTSSVPTLNVGDQMKTYEQISQMYSGIVPSSAQFRNTEVSARAWTTANNPNLLSPNHAAYIYEHPYESTRRTYLVVYGRYTDGNNVSTYGFYKLDIGMRNATSGVFEYYNIIRNIHYNVRITHVYAPGTPTVAEAIAHTPFNNLTGAVETSTMLNVSNGQNLLIVNDTNHIIVTDNATVDIMYRYIKDVTGTKTEANSVPKVVGLVAGPVIKKVVNVNPEACKVKGVNWMKISLEINNPTSVTKSQSITIVDNDGLQRTINLVLRNPWRYEKLKYSNGNESTYFATIAPTTSNQYATPVPQNISCEIGEPLTVFFDLPDGLLEYMFPLEFQIESKNQGIENDKVGNLLVQTGASLFDPNRLAISYIKTVSHAEYLYQYVDDNSNDVDINKPNTRHTVRCRFLTINSVENGSDGEIRIHNEYFLPDANVTFKRVSNPTANPTP